jgi:DNA-directed RNA polymerase specialized sigma24 family protein
VGRSSYSEKQVRELVEGYAELEALKDTNGPGLIALLKLADLDRALKQLALKYREVVLLHGQLGLPQEAAAQELNISQPALGKRYRHSLEELTWLINGGD